MKLKATQLLATALFMAMAAPCEPAVRAEFPAEAHIMRFDLISHGMTVGHGSVTRAPALRNGKACMELRLEIESKVDMLLYKYALKMDEVWVTDSTGLIAYKYIGTENGRQKTINGELRNGVFHFEITEAGQKRVWTTPRAAFELTANGHPGQALAKDEVKNICVLDPATCAISERKYRGTGAEMLTVGKRQVMCDTVTIEYPGAHIRRWFITDKFGPLILREDGRERRGTYSRRATSLELERASAE